MDSVIGQRIGTGKRASNGKRSQRVEVNGEEGEGGGGRGVESRFADAVRGIRETERRDEQRSSPARQSNSAAERMRAVCCREWTPKSQRPKCDSRSSSERSEQEKRMRISTEGQARARASARDRAMSMRANMSGKNFQSKIEMPGILHCETAAVPLRPRLIKACPCPVPKGGQGTRTGTCHEYKFRRGPLLRGRRELKYDREHPFVSELQSCREGSTPGMRLPLLLGWLSRLPRADDASRASAKRAKQCQAVPSTSASAPAGLSPLAISLRPAGEPVHSPRGSDLSAPSSGLRPRGHESGDERWKAVTKSCLGPAKAGGLGAGLGQWAQG
ncbi:hypothetical protein BDZ91DRAFT_829947 [Kalaharituber pfeilii]|nr:hypothetical protein BDZ91DRAFT_829947 [Kalaharituber pfeilii]